MVHLQGQRQANEVHHHLFVGQLHAEETQQSVEGFVVLLAAALFLTAQVDVAVQLLTVLRRNKDQTVVQVGLTFTLRPISLPWVSQHAARSAIFVPFQRFMYQNNQLFQDTPAMTLGTSAIYTFGDFQLFNQFISQ